MTVFNKPPNQWQVEVVGSILCSYKDNIEHNQLLISKTGEGKSQVHLVTGACIGGVTLCISPLLSLVMDQSHKVLKLTPTTSTVSSYHLDEMYPSLLQKVQTALIYLPPIVSSFIFTSPHCFCNHHHFQNFLFRHRLINFVVVDKIHLFSQFGKTFRNKFHQLKRSLFDRLLQSDWKILTLFMTPTCTNNMFLDLECLLGYSLQ